jgi:hypothetical protein
MTPSTPLESRNRELAQRINEEARTNPDSPYVGRFVGIANGKVVVVADNWLDVLQQLRSIEPDPKKCYAVEASADYDSVHEIWNGV